MIEHKFVISVKQKYKKMLPIALKSFHIKNYRGIIDTQIDNIPPDTQWIFLTGENGFGKTSVLQAIAENINLRSIENYVETSLVFLVDGKPIYSPAIIDKIQNGTTTLTSTLINLGNAVVAYGSTRLRISGSTTKEILNKYTNMDTLFSDDSLLIDIEEKFKDWKVNYLKGFKALENIFKTLLPKLSKIDVEFDQIEKKSKVKYFEVDDYNNVYENGNEFLDLATGYRNIIAMIGDMLIQLSMNKPINDYKNLSGIVLIDEIDLHLHPKYQKLFVQKLTELFPKIQFFVSTHSPIPLLGAPKNSVIINVTRTLEEGIKAELLDIDFSVLTPNAILSSPIFGFQDLIPESKSDDEMIRTEDTYKEVLFNDQLDKQISEYLTEDNQKELLDLLKEHNL